jgi:hypothetical protein
MLNGQDDKYLYRRQYLLSPHVITNHTNWKHLKISENHFLTTHPDLPVTETHCQNRAIYLLGYIIDSCNPLHDDLTIMQGIAEKSKKLDEVFIHLAEKCGRFVVIAKMDDTIRIFSDACGMRQVYYHVDHNNSVWCSSQPHLIAMQLGIGINEATKKDLYKAPLFRTTEHWYPGNITLFNDIFHLTPNHYFDFITLKSVRYWPTKRLDPISMSECIPKVSELLSGIIEGAVHRFNLAFAISCGLDSRTLFAASRKVAKKIHFITQADAESAESDPDVLIPSLLLKQLGLEHSVLTLPKTLDDDFKTVLEKNVFTARVAKGLNAASIFDHFKNDTKEIVVLYGNCSEITKRDRFRFPKTSKFLLSGTALATMVNMNHSGIALKEFSKWLTSVKKLTKYNVDILDLMHWEQRVGNWGAMAFSEYEMVYESLCPYSCRKYIEYMLSVSFKFRTKPDYKLHHAIISSLWPEALQQEINPEKNKIIKSIEDILYRTNIYDPVKFLYLMLYKRFK